VIATGQIFENLPGCEWNTRKWNAPVNSEQEIMRRARQFDRHALAEIYDRYNLELYRYARRLLGNADQAEECVAEVFNRLLGVVHNGGGPHDHLRAYLYRVAHNWITDRWRRQTPPCLAIDAARADGGALDLDQVIADHDDQTLVRNALMHLTCDQRQVVLLRFYEGWETNEIALALDKPPGAIKALQHRAVIALRKMLQEH
jgi:RNA polymerase sigma-70 factor (ECF subfamily)